MFSNHRSGGLHDAQKVQLPGEECCNRDLIRGVQHRGRGAAALASQTGKPHSRENVFVDRFEGPFGRRGPIAPGSDVRNPIRPGEGQCNRQSHIWRTCLRQGGAIGELNHRVHDRLRMHDDIDAVDGDIEEEVRLDHLESLIHHRCGVDGHQRPHVPRWMSQGLVGGDRGQFPCTRAAKRPTTCGEHQASHLTRPAATQALCNRGMLRINRHNLARRSRRLNQRTADDERFLIGQGQSPPTGEGGKRRFQAGRPTHRVDDNIGRLASDVHGCLGSRDDARQGKLPRRKATSRGLRVQGQLEILRRLSLRDRHNCGARRQGLFGQQCRIATPSGERNDLKFTRISRDDIKGLRSNRSGTAQQDHAATRHVWSLCSAGSGQRKQDDPTTLSPMTTLAADTDITQQRLLLTEVPGPASRALLERRNAAVSQGVGIMLPAFIVRAGGGILVDADGNQLIDLGSGIAVTTVGNANPYVAQRVAEQVANVTHTCFMVTPYEGYVAVCEALNRLTPGDHAKRSALFNSGAEAVENAVKIARTYTGRQAVVVVEHGYHGRTNLTMGMTAKAMPYKHGFGPFAPEIYRVPTSYPFRDGPHDGAEVARWAISRMTKEVGPDQIAAIVIEPIQGEGGFIVPAPGYFRAMADFAAQHGIMFIADEIQTGFCRTGQWFASEHENVVPDMMTTAKGIAGGMPLAAVTGRADVMDAVHAGGLGGTYGGNPVACAGALGSIAWMEDVDACARARDIERVMLPRLAAMQEVHPAIGDIRGRGAMLAIEIVQPGTTQPDAERTAAINTHCHRNGVVTLTTGTFGNVLRFLPPLTISQELLTEGLDVVAAAFDATAAR